MDRLDYLKRDSFYTGASEGNINSERIIEMLNVKDDKSITLFLFILSNSSSVVPPILTKTKYASVKSFISSIAVEVASL